MPPVPLPPTLLEPILAEPGADFPRLRAAEWLIERGEQDYGDFIQVQIELALPEPVCEAPAYTRHGVLDCAEWNGRHPDRNKWCHPCSQRRELRRRERDLFSSVARAYWHWLGGPERWPLPIGAGLSCWRRGFLAVVECTLEDWGGHGKAIMRAQPVETVRATNREPYHNAAGSYLWASYSSFELAGRLALSVLPEGIFGLLADDIDVWNRATWRTYLTAAAAHQALSRALVRWAREAA